MEFRIADTFQSSLSKLTTQEQKAVKMTAFDLQMGLGGNSQQFHRIERAKDQNFWSVRANNDIRIIVHKTAASIMLCYVDHHDDAYAWADLVICRAGAITVAELCIAGLGAIFIPYPHAVDDHQTANASALVNAGAALMIDEKNLTTEKLALALKDLLENRVKIKAFADAASAFAKPQAAQDVAKVCVQACFGKSSENINMVKDF